MKQVSLTGGSPWGFRLVGGSDFRASLAISKVTPGGKASCAGLKPGDIITSINSLDTTQMTHLEAQNIVKATGASLVLGISSSSSPTADASSVAPPPAAQPTKPKMYQSSTTIPIGKPATFSITTPTPPAPTNAKTPPPVATKPWSAPKRPSDFIINTPTFADDDPLPPPPPSLSSPPPATLPAPPAELPPPPSAFSPPPPAPKPTNIPPPKQEEKKNVQFSTLINPGYADLPPPPSLDSLSINDKPTNGNADNIEVFCEACGKVITGAYLTAQGKNWHPECFVCAIPGCKKSLQNIGFMEEKGQRYCSDCYEKLFANACGKCHKKIIGEVMHALNKTWCVNCFVCVSCSKPFRDGVFHLEGDKPYCIECFNNMFSTVCKACGFRIEAGDGYVEAIKSSWHESCFNCTVCHIDLKNCGFLAVKGLPVCSNRTCSTQLQAR